MEHLDINKCLDLLGLNKNYWELTKSDPPHEFVKWGDNNKDLQPTQSELQDVWDKYIADHKSQEYARNRQAEYPDWGTQLNKIYDDGIAKWKSEMVDPIKAKYPKPE